MSGERYYRKIWEWWCWSCGGPVVYEEVVVDGKNRENLKCSRCGVEMDGRPFSGEWACEGCMTVKNL